jgi:hypothetical protein
MVPESARAVSSENIAGIISLLRTSPPHHGSIDQKKRLSALSIALPDRRRSMDLLRSRSVFKRPPKRFRSRSLSPTSARAARLSACLSSRQTSEGIQYCHIVSDSAVGGFQPSSLYQVNYQDSKPTSAHGVDREEAVHQALPPGGDGDGIRTGDTCPSLTPHGRASQPLCGESIEPCGNHPNQVVRQQREMGGLQDTDRDGEPLGIEAAQITPKNSLQSLDGNIDSGIETASIAAGPKVDDAAGPRKEPFVSGSTSNISRRNQSLVPSPAPTAPLPPLPCRSRSFRPPARGPGGGNGEGHRYPSPRGSASARSHSSDQRDVRNQQEEVKQHSKRREKVPTAENGCAADAGANTAGRQPASWDRRERTRALKVRDMRAHQRNRKTLSQSQIRQMEAAGSSDTESARDSSDHFARNAADGRKRLSIYRDKGTQYRLADTGLASGIYGDEAVLRKVDGSRNVGEHACPIRNGPRTGAMSEPVVGIPEASPSRSSPRVEMAERIGRLEEKMERLEAALSAMLQSVLDRGMGGR